MTTNNALNHNKIPKVKFLTHSSAKKFTKKGRNKLKEKPAGPYLKKNVEKLKAINPELFYRAYPNHSLFSPKTLFDKH